MSERKIYLCTDEEVSYILTGLHLLIQDNIKNNISCVNINNLLTNVENSYDIGVISNEKFEL